MIIVTKLRSILRRAQRRIERSVLRLGNSVECTFCGWTGLRFMPAGLRRDPNRLCPGCGSLERYRMLPLLLGRELGGDRHASVLELAPKACFTRYCRNQTGWRYISSDLGSPTAMVRGDLRAMPFASSSFDVIVCLHVLEHIREDGPAFREIARMLKPGGLGVICVPLQGETTQEGAPPSQWLQLYGQADHVRYYGMDIVGRMKNAGLTVRCIDTRSYFTPIELQRHALVGDDRYIFFVHRTGES
jgi:SAM-dependent methyltransferase